MSKNPRHRAGDEPVPAEVPVPQFDFIAPSAQQDVAPPAATVPIQSVPVESVPAESERAMTREPTDNVAIVAGLFGGSDAPESPRRTEPEGSLGDLVRPAFVPDAPVMQTWLDAPAPAVPSEAPPGPQRGRRAASHTDENVFGG